MKVYELIKQLEQLEQDLEIYCVSNEGRDFDPMRGNPFRLDRVWTEHGPEEVIVIDIG